MHASGPDGVSQAILVMVTDIEHSIIDQFLWKVPAERGLEMSIIADCRSSFPLAATPTKLASYPSLLSDKVTVPTKTQNPIPQLEKWGLYPPLFGAAFFSMK
jgi:hypothetical protein